MRLATREWDVIVVGAGPAGAMSAILLARQGRRVLLVEKSEFPREKVCGCCMSARGARVLRDHGLDAALDGAVELNHIEIRYGGHSLRLGIPTGCAISRSTLDQRLVGAAVSAGVAFLPQTRAELSAVGDDSRFLHLTRGEAEATVSAPLILACDGINGSLLAGESGCEWQIAPDAWLGVAVSVDEPDFPSPKGVIAMHVGADGYIGSVRLNDGTLHLAAALQPAACRDRGGPIPVMHHILEQAGVPRCRRISDAKVKGTALLTRQRRRFGSERVLAVGDACAYIEPFTGEGMTWALESAALLCSSLPSNLGPWIDDTPERWQELQKQTLGAEQLLCRALRFTVHRETLMAGIIRFGRWLPSIGEAIAASMERPGLARNWS